MQRAISVGKQAVKTLETNESNKCHSMLINTSVTFVAQWKSVYGGLFLAIFEYHVETEMELLDAINYDESIIHL